MPAKSKSQHRAAGAAYAAKCKGAKIGLKGASKKMAKMSCKELKKFAGTKEKGLPKKVKESVQVHLEGFIQSICNNDFVKASKCLQESVRAKLKNLIQKQQTKEIE